MSANITVKIMGYLDNMIQPSEGEASGVANQPFAQNQPKQPYGLEHDEKICSACRGDHKF